jgi:hypothetical protein
MTQTPVARFAADPLAFIRALTIPSAHGPRRFGDCMAAFQAEAFADIAPAMLAVARGERPEPARFWWERTKGGSKDSDLACVLLWLLAFSPRPLACQVGAADADQADELRKAAKAILRLNPWLGEVLKVQAWSIVNGQTDSVCDIIASDVAGSHGARPDVLILNELSHVAKQEFAENLLDNASKVPHGLVCIATNAGWLDTWQARWRETFAASGRWSMRVLAEPSPWLDAAELAEARQRNSVQRYRRLWEGVWAHLSGDALSEDDLLACLTRDRPIGWPERGCQYVAGLDLGTKRDRSALVVLGADSLSQRLHLADCQAWCPGGDGKVNLAAVREETRETAQRFGCPVHFDPHQAALLVQDLSRDGVRCVEAPFTPSNLNAMASATMQVFRERRLDLYRDDELLRDLRRLAIVERAFGYKLEAPHDAQGHADRAFALAIALPAALEALRYGTGSVIVLPGNSLLIGGDGFGRTAAGSCERPLRRGFPRLGGFVHSPGR